MLVSGWKAAKMAGCSTNTIYKAINEGKLKAEKNGGIFKIDTDELAKVFPASAESQPPRPRGRPKGSYKLKEKEKAKEPVVKIKDEEGDQPDLNGMMSVLELLVSSIVEASKKEQEPELKLWKPHVASDEDDLFPCHTTKRIKVLLAGGKEMEGMCGEFCWSDTPYPRDVIVAWRPL